MAIQPSPSAARITEIDISRPARSLSILRWSDYIRVVACGFGALNTLPDLVREAANAQWGDFIASALLAAAFTFAAVTGWRHVGVIDPRVWRSYLWVFPILVAIAALMAFATATKWMTQGVQLSKSVEPFVIVAVVLNFAGIAIPGFICVLLLRRTRVMPIGRRIDDLLADLRARSGTSAIGLTSVPQRSRRRGLLYAITGAVVLLAVILAPLPMEGRQASTIWRTIDQLRIFAFFLLVRARRYFQVDADSLLAVDKRPPILFLRSFADDERQHYTSSQRALLDFSLETRLANHFYHFGPFIAIGSPKETVPELGAARVLLSDDEWQPRVLGWMKDANLIIMYSGTTQWVNWELRKVVESGRTTSLILMFPELKGRLSKRKLGITARTEQIREVFKDTPWTEELTEFSDFANLRAMLFRADGSMVMIKSRSRRRDAYHLAALIAHQQLLEPDNVTQSAAAREHAPRSRSSLVAVGALASAVVVVLGAVYLFTPPGDSRLTFKQGELYYGGSVTQEEVRRVGEYLVQQQFFSDERGSTVQLHQEQGRYRLWFVINSKYAEDPLTAIQFGMFGNQIARDMLGGRPIEVGLSDDHLNLIRIVPSSAMMVFEKGELYYTEPVTAAEANAVGELLMKSGFFSDAKATSVHVGQEDGAYQLKFVIDPSRGADPEIKAAFRELSRGIAVEALGGRPVAWHLCDDHFRTLQSERL